jgi:protein-glutamine gamma-glutamyltransferase
MVRISTLLNILTYSIALLGYAPLFPFLEAVPRAIFPVAFIGGLWADRKGYRLHGAIPTVFSILFFLFYVAQFNRENLVGPAVNLLMVLLAVRLISEKNVRNYLQIFALALFSLASSSLFTLNALFLVYLMLLLVLIPVALVVLTFHAADKNLAVAKGEVKTVLSVALLLPAAAIPLMLVFFIILPRTQYPLWNFLNVAGSRVIGFSEKVQPGAASSVGETKNAAFRVSCEKLPKEQLYWRGIVLNALAANAWVREEPAAGETGSIAPARTVYQTIYPEPGKSRYLFALNIPRQITGVRASLTGDFVLKTDTASVKRVKYEAVSVLSDVISTRRGIDREYYLRLPHLFSPRILALGRGIAERGKSDEDKVDLLKQFYVAANIGYATSDLPISANPLDEFLFVKKRGNCEFFASSFAVLLRAAGIPSRLVGGYYGGEYNELGGYYLITEDMAHVWVEAYLTGKGWVMVDPSGLSADFKRVVERGQPGFATRLRMYLDSFNYYWNVAVITYDLEKQLQLVNKVNLRLKRFSFAVPPGTTLLKACIPLILLVLVVVVARSRSVSREEKILKKFFRRIKRKYPFAITPSVGLHELAAQTNDPRIAKFAAIYGEAIYHDRKLSVAECRILEELLREL